MPSRELGEELCALDDSSARADKTGLSFQMQCTGKTRMEDTQIMARKENACERKLHLGEGLINDGAYVRAELNFLRPPRCHAPLVVPQKTALHPRELEGGGYKFYEYPEANM